MHHPADQPRPSLYFPYQVFPAWQPRGARAPEVPVAVVGAGPVGLVLALSLARLGVRVLLLEAERQVSEGSRAIVFTRRSMEILQQVGADRAVTAAGLPWRFGNSFYRGQCVFRMQAPQDEHDRFGPLTNLQQQYLEAALLEQVAQQPLIELRWGQKVDALSRHDDTAAVLSVDTPSGRYEQPADWVVACDGARSGLRQHLGLRMEGDAYEGRFVIADIRVDLPFPTERRAYFDPDWNRGNTVLMHREPHGIWRIDYQLPAGETPEQALEPASLKARIDAQLAMIGHAGLPWQMDWCSVYSARAMTLPTYQQGRVLLAGDAAHLLPIFGVRGANTGLQDAQNLAWQLAAVVQGQAGPALLASYSDERVGAAREIIDEAGRSTRFMTPPTRGFRLLRDAVLSLSLTQPFVGPLFHWRTSRAHDHPLSVLNTVANAEGRAGEPGPAPHPGSPGPNVQFGADDFLLDHVGDGFTLLHWAAEGPVPAAMVEAAHAVLAPASGLPLRVLAIRHHGEAVAGADITRADATGQAARRYGVDAAGATVLMRPDQHLCARWPQAQVPAPVLQAALRRALGHEINAATLQP